MTLLIVVKGRTSAAADFCIGPIDASSRDLTSEVNTASERERMQRTSIPKRFGNGVEDANEVLASLVVHPERIVVPLRTRKASGQ